MPHTRRIQQLCRAALILLVGVSFGAPPPARAAQPLTIGFNIEQTGGLAPNGTAALLAMQIWEADVNAKGGLLGRPVRLLYYDDQSDPAKVPAIVTKLLDVDKVDFLLGGNGTNQIAAAMPTMMQRHLVMLSLFALAVNSEFDYDRYFSMNPPGGPNPKESFTEGFFRVAESLRQKPRTIAIAGADAEFSKNAMDGARAHVGRAGLQIVYDKAYPPQTVDYTPIARAIGAANADLVLVCSYPPDTVGMIRAVREIGLRAQLFGGCMVGLQATALKTQLGPLLNGIVNYDLWFPWVHFASSDAKAFLAEYQAKAPEKRVDLLGYYLPPSAYARMQVLQQAIEATGGLDQDKLADYLHSHTFETIVGAVKFGSNGEWAEARTLEVQFQDVKGNGIDQFKNPSTEVILWPPSEKNGTLRIPYNRAQK